MRRLRGHRCRLRYPRPPLPGGQAEDHGEYETKQEKLFFRGEKIHRILRRRGQPIAERKMRQPIFLLCACLLVGMGPRPAAASGKTTVREEIAALQLLEAARREQVSKADEEKIEAAYRDLVRRHPESAEAGNAYAAHLYDTGSVARALAKWREMLDRHPENAEAAFQFGHATLQHGDTGEALDFLRRAARSPEATPFQIVSFANALYLFRKEARGRTAEAALEEALAEFERAARLEPANLEYLRAYAETYFALPRPDWGRALEAWKRVVTLTPDGDPALGFYLLQAARAALHAGDAKAALGFLDRLPADRNSRVTRRLRQQAEDALAHTRKIGIDPRGVSP